MKNKQSFKWVGWLILFGMCLFLSFNKHSKSGYFNYHSEIWADKAGYYVYLPAVLGVGLDLDELPDSIADKTGNGFRIDEDEKFITKYPYGVALMQLPFFLIAEMLSNSEDPGYPGFTPIHHGSINVAATFYAVVGLFFLYSLLRIEFSATVSLSVVLSVFIGTNLFYYSIDETGMSHVYSFTIFSILLFLVKKTHYLKKSSIAVNFLFGILLGLVLVLRPLNMVFLLILPFLDLPNREAIWSRFNRFLQPFVLVPIIIGLILALVPQFVYWKYAFGSFLTYSYVNEGFNWLSPMIQYTFFSPNNGLILYAPLVIFMIIGLFIMSRRKLLNSILIGGMFLVLSYLLSTWWDWGFGCSFGARNYVEYFAVLSLPLAFFYQKLLRQSTLLICLCIFLIVSFLIFNLKLTYSYDECFYGARDWDWGGFWNLITSPTK